VRRGAWSCLHSHIARLNKYTMIHNIFKGGFYVSIGLKSVPRCGFSRRSPILNQIRQFLMEHDECKIVRWHMPFKEQDHVHHSDGTRRGRNREVALVLQRAGPRTLYLSKYPSYLYSNILSLRKLFSSSSAKALILLIVVSI